MRASADNANKKLATATTEDIRLNLSDYINRVLYRSERVRVTRRGKPVMALVPLEDLEFLEKVLDALEDDIDLPVIKERLLEFDRAGEGVPWEQVKADRKVGQS